MTARDFLIPPDHPYIARLKPALVKTAGGKWIVKWRDFMTMNQDAEFSSKEEAKRFARKLVLGPHIVHEVSPRDFEDADRWWRDLYSD